MEATAKKNSAAQSHANEKIFIEKNEPAIKKEQDRYLKLFEALKTIPLEFEKIGIGTISALQEILEAVNNGEVTFLQNRLEKLIKQDPENYPGLKNFRKEKLPELFNMNSPDAFYSAVRNAVQLSQGLSFEWFTYNEGDVVLNQEKLLNFLSEKWSFYLTDPKDITTYHRRKAFAEACNIMFREEGLSLTNLHFFIENTGGYGSDYKPKFSFTPPWNTAGW